MQFDYESTPARVLFGAGRITEAGAEARRLGMSRALVLSTPGQSRLAERVVAILGDRGAGLFAGAAMHTPVDLTERAMDVLQARGADGIVAIGGGSAIGLSKAIALRTDLPQLAIPTTYAGSEMTPVLGETKNKVKSTQSSPRIRPETVIYDVELTTALPADTSVTSGINAVAHAVEALYARDRNPVVDLMAAESVAALFQALPIIAQTPADLAARGRAQYGAWLAGTCLGAVGMALHHKLCHAIGGTFDLPHAGTHTVILPHALAYNASHAPDAVSVLSRVMGGADPARRLADWARVMGAPTSLSELGMPHEGIGQIVSQAIDTPYWNPRPLDPAALTRCLERAWVGEQPAGD